MMHLPLENITRRSMLGRVALGAGALALAGPLRGARASRRKRMGVVVTSFMLRGRQADEGSRRYPPFEDALDLIEYCHRELKAGGVQTGVRGWDRAFARQVRRKLDEHGIYCEGQINLPRDESDLARFEAEVGMAREAGVTVHRVALGGRRYEDFDRLEQFESARASAWKRLRLAEPVVARHRVRVGVENHKDWRITDLLAFMTGLDSEYIGTCVDTGNSISLLEQPEETVRAFAKHAVTTHIKDMGVKEYEEGFLLSEVPLGEGFLDMNRLLDLCEEANPAIRFNLEMITRDPLRIPCLTDRYWATLGEIRGRRLAEILAMVRAHQSPGPLPGITGRTGEEQLEYEEANVKQCLRFAERELGLDG